VAAGRRGEMVSSAADLRFRQIRGGCQRSGRGVVSSSAGAAAEAAADHLAVFVKKSFFLISPLPSWGCVDAVALDAQAPRGCTCQQTRSDGPRFCSVSIASTPVAIVRAHLNTVALRTPRIVGRPLAHARAAPGERRAICSGVLGIAVRAQ